MIFPVWKRLNMWTEGQHCQLLLDFQAKSARLQLLRDPATAIKEQVLHSFNEGTKKSPKVKYCKTNLIIFFGHTSNL